MAAHEIAWTSAAERGLTNSVTLERIRTLHDIDRDAVVEADFTNGPEVSSASSGRCSCPADSESSQFVLSSTTSSRRFGGFEPTPRVRSERFGTSSNDAHLKSFSLD